MSTLLQSISGHRAVVLVGDYGSGKTEVAVNLSLHLGQERDGPPVAIADLDLVNPYFRCREAREPLEEAGIRVVMPRGGQQFADLPILLPQVKGLLQADDTLAVLDVGGDEVGSRVLASLAPVLDPERHALWFVANANRPFCDTPEGCQRAIERIQRASGARVSGLVANTHLMDETTPQMVRDGVDLAEAAARELGVPVALVTVMQAVAQEMDLEQIPYPVLRMRRLMVPPWLRRPGADAAAQRLGVT